MVQSGTYIAHPAAFLDQPFAAPHQSFLSTGSEVPFDKKSSFPPGEAKNSETFGIYHSLKRSVSWVLGGKAARVARLATPTELRGFWRCPFNEPLCCVSFGRLRASPTMAVQDHGHIPLNVVHPLSQPVRAASSPFREPRRLRRRREAKSLPYNGRCKIARAYHSTQYTPGAALKKRLPPVGDSPNLNQF